MKENSRGRILVVDDEDQFVQLICDCLSIERYEVVGLTSPLKAVELLEEQEFDILLADLMMSEMDGIRLLGACKERDPNLVGIIMTGQGTIRTSVEAMKIGAFDYLLKPFPMDSLVSLIDRAMQVRKLQQENIELRGTMAIYELTKMINVTLDVHAIAGKIADAAMELSRADEVSVMLPTPEGDKLYVAAIRGDQRDQFLGQQEGMEEGIAGWVARHRETLILKGEIDDPRFRLLARRPEIRTAVSLPMLAGGKLVGVVNINATRSRSFSDGQVRALDVMVGISAPSIENSSLFRRMQDIEEKYRGIVENAVEGIFQMTPNGRILTANPAFVRILGYESLTDLLAAQDIVRQISADETHSPAWVTELKQQGEILNFETRIVRRDRKEVWALINARIVRDRDGHDLHYEGTFVDVSRQKEMENVLIQALREWRATFDAIHDMVWLCDPDGKVLRCNRAAKDYLNKPFSEIIDRSCFRLMHGTDGPIENCPLFRARATRTREAMTLQIGENWYNVTVDPIVDDNGEMKGAVHVVSDITQSKRAEEELRAMSLRDELTGLLNRRGFVTLAEQQLRLVQRMKKRLIMLFIDLDRMKWINDTLGHPEGDLALQKTGAVLKKTFRESDIIARVGGDEFVVVTLNAFDESMETVLGRLEKNLSLFKEAHQDRYPLSLSIGAVSSDEEEHATIETLLKKADQRMYENKKKKNLNAL